VGICGTDTFKNKNFKKIFLASGNMLFFTETYFYRRPGTADPTEAHEA
jgi:hypothetical protein